MWRTRTRVSGTSRNVSRDAPTSSVQSTASTTKTSTAGNGPRSRRAMSTRYERTAETRQASADRHDVARGRVAPHPPVDAERDEGHVADAEQDRERGEEDRALELAAEGPDDQHVRAEERRTDDDEVDDDLDEAARLEDERAPERRLRGLVAPPGALLEVAQEAPELHEQDEGHEHAERGQAAVVEHVVRQRGRADRRRHEREQEHGLRLREAVVDEPVRGVVPAALRDRPPLREPHDRDERRVEDRDREDEQRQQHRRDRGSRDRPARGERERGEREPEHLAPRVAHEDVRGAPGPQVEGEEARAGPPEREREDEHGLALVLGQRVDREVRARDRGQRRREAVHVVEQVERVRDPDEPEDPDAPGEDVVADDLHLQPAGERDHRGADLDRELDEGAQVPQVVDQPGREEERGAGEDPAQLAAPLDRADRERRPIPATKPRKMPTPPNVGVACSCQRSPLGWATRRLPIDDRRRIQRTATVTGNAAIATIASTTRKG